MSSFTEKNKKEINDVLQFIEDNKNEINIDNKIKSILFNRMKSIVVHDLWYSKTDREKISKKACELYFFTKKQKESLKYSSLGNYEDEGDWSFGSEYWMAEHGITEMNGLYD